MYLFAQVTRLYLPITLLTLNACSTEVVVAIQSVAASRAALANAHTTLAGASTTLTSAKTRSRGQRR